MDNGCFSFEVYLMSCVCVTSSLCVKDGEVTSICNEISEGGMEVNAHREQHTHISKKHTCWEAVFVFFFGCYNIGMDGNFEIISVLRMFSGKNTKYRLFVLFLGLFLCCYKQQYF